MTDTIMKVTRARAAMVQSQRFFGALALRLTPQEKAIDSMATDGVNLFYNPKWVDEQGMPEITGVCAKMVSHLALLHHTRRRDRDPARWKRSCDFAANQLVLDAGFTLPEGALINQDYAGKSAEEIYRLEQQREQDEQDEKQQDPSGEPASDDEQSAGGDDAAPDEQPPGDPEAGADPDPGNAGQVLDAVNEDGSTPSKADMTTLESEQQIAVQQAKGFADRAGQGSDDQKRLLDDLKQAQYDWREELRRFVLQRTKDDITWTRLNRRMHAHGLLMPSLYAPKMGHMVLVVDVSYSVLDWLQEFCDHLKTIWEDVRPTSLTVIYCAASVTGVDEIGPEDDFLISPRGQGGTDLRKAFAYLAEQDFDPDCCIVLTDMETPFPEHAPDYPVIWAATTKIAEPWGERVQLKR